MNKTRQNLLTRSIVVCAAIIAAPIAYLVVRSKTLLKHTAELIAICDQFPRDYQVGNPMHKPLLYVALGDSTAAGVGANRFEESYPYLIAQHLASKSRYVHVINVAVSGARVDDVQATQLLKMRSLEPDLVTMTIGANDATSRTNEAKFDTSLESVLDGFALLDNSRWIISTVPDVSYCPAIQPIYGHIAGIHAHRLSKS